MALFEINPDSFRAIKRSSLVQMKLKERGDLQRLLRKQIEVLDDDLYVLTEEFGEWEDSKRRIDLLAIDKQANLVVIELKRTQDGGHMELQALRYASMVSAMTFERATQIHAQFLANNGGEPERAEALILDFLVWDEPDEENFGTDVRVVLVSEDFGIELTTAVLWLREHDIDIRCIRLRPYTNRKELLVDVQQIIPLPEAQEYQVQIRAKEQKGKKERSERYDIRLRFWNGVVNLSRANNGRHGNLKPGPYHWMGASSGTRGLGLNYVVIKDTSVTELYIDRGDKQVNKRIFDELFAKRDVIEKAFGDKLSWERLDTKRACRIKFIVSTGGYRSPEAEWPKIHEELVNSMERLWKALELHVNRLKL